MAKILKTGRYERLSIALFFAACSYAAAVIADGSFQSLFAFLAIWHLADWVVEAVQRIWARLIVAPTAFSFSFAYLVFAAVPTMKVVVFGCLITVWHVGLWGIERRAADKLKEAA